MTNTLSLFGIEPETSAITAPKKTMKDRREECANKLEKLAKANPVTWDVFCATLAETHWAVTPTKNLYISAFGREKAAKVWIDTEARWCILQAISARYVLQLNDCSADENARRRTAIFDTVRRLFAYHGCALSKKDLTPAMLIDIGSAAVKYAFTEDGAEAKALGVSTFIRTVFWTVMGYDSKEATISALATKASTIAEKVRGVGGNGWHDKPYPCTLTTEERKRLEDLNAENS